jgi:hypothetical protein
MTDLTVITMAGTLCYAAVGVLAWRELRRNPEVYSTRRPKRTETNATGCGRRLTEAEVEALARQGRLVRRPGTRP